MAARATFSPDPRLDPRLEMKGFFVHVDGGQPVGPVSATQIARGFRAGKIPSEASVQWQGEVFWRGLFDEPAVIAALKAL
jgi:hypothetical protein